MSRIRRRRAGDVADTTGCPRGVACFGFVGPLWGRRFAQCASCLAGVSRARSLRVSGNGISTADAATMHPRTRASYGGCHRSVTISPRVRPIARPRATSKSCRLRMTSEVPLLRISITAPVEISETMKFVRYWCMGGVVGRGGSGEREALMTRQTPREAVPA